MSLFYQIVSAQVESFGLRNRFFSFQKCPVRIDTSNLIKIKRKILNIRTTTSAYQFYQLLRLVTLVLISIFLVKLSFSREDTSTFELFLFIVNICTFFWTMGISNSLLAYYPKLKDKEKKIFFQNIFLMLQTAGFLIAFLLFLTNGFGLIKNDTLLTSGGIVLLALYIFFYSPTLLIEIKYILNKEAGKLKRYAVSIFLLELLIILITALLYRNINPVLTALVLWIFIRWLYAIYIVFNFSTTFSISINLIKAFFIFSVPVIIHILLGNGMEYIDGIIVGQKFSPDMFSVYRYGAREFPLILILIGALRSTMIPEAIEKPDIAYEKIKNQTSRIIKLYFPLAIVLMLSSKYLYSFFYSSQYSYSAILFNIYLLIISSRIIMSEVFIYANHMNKLFMQVSFIELLANIILSLILLQYWGIAGIAFTTFISFMGSKLYLVYIVKKKINIPLKRYLNLKLYLSYTVLLYLSFIISIYLFSIL